jgi:hypothetical protein
MDPNNYLIIGGSTKCGTTSVFNYFEFHPDICPCVMKESRFFWTGEYTLSAAPRKQIQVNQFTDLFDNCRNNRIRMEATPDYLYSAESALKIHEQLPNCKIVFILREPFSRLISWYNFALLNNLIPKQTTLEEYITLQTSASTNSLPQHLRALEQGKYAKYLNEYRRIFGEENILITFYEDLISHPANFCKNIAKFIGIDQKYFDGFEFKIYNRTVAAKSTTAHGLFRKMKRTIRPVTRIFHPAIRKNLKLAGYHMESVYQLANKSESGEIVMPEPNVQEFLDNYYREENNSLRKITRNQLPW